VGDPLLALQISGVHASGAGVGEAQGAAVVVEGAAPGDVIDGRVVHVSQHAPATAWAELVRVRERGADFVRPTCDHWAPTNGRCGGCPLMHLSAEAQGRWKRGLVQAAVDAAAPRGGAAGVEVAWCAPPGRDGYRNRAHYVAALGADGAPMLGAYAPRSHIVTSQARCEVVHPLIRATAQGLEAALRALRVPIYQAPGALRAGAGEDVVRYVTLRVAPSLPPQRSKPQRGGGKGRGEAAPVARCLVEWVCAGLGGAWLDDLLAATCALEGVVGAGASLNATGGNAIHVEAPQVWRGERAVVEQVGPLGVALTTDAFFQLNAAVAAQMYARAAAMMPEGVATVWDLYCGAGALGVTAALRHRSKYLCGAESNSSAVAAARALAEAMGLEGARFAALDLGRDPLPEDWPAPDVVLVNPPRQGLDAALLPVLAASPARELIYMSCSPTTLGRDLAALGERGGWRVVAAEAYDMLPHTAHVEALVALRRAADG
jgi:23S rRNA (uracil1939-C5)-methyltransferase